MSMGEIADNKWETEAAKTPIKDAGGIGQVLLIGGLGLFFSWIVVMSCVAIVSPKKEGTLADQYKDLGAEAKEAKSE
jgi:hypothetical protein